MPSKDYHKQEKKKLMKFLTSNPPDIRSIKERVWMENGLLGMSIRRDAWLLFLGEDPSVIYDCPNYTEDYREERQIQVDIMRSFVHFEGYDHLDAVTLESHRSNLNRVLKAVLMEDDSLYYYQGFHDIAEFLLLVSDFDINWTYTMMKSLTKSYLKDYMHSNMKEVEKLLLLLYPILEIRAKELIPVLQNPDKYPIVILPWVITLFTHSLSSLSQVARLFDVMLLHPLMPLYVSASVILHFKRDLIGTEERCQVFQILGRLSKQRLPLEAILRDTQFFYTALPPSNLLFKGGREGIVLAKDSMITQYEKRELQEKRKANVNSIYQLVVHPGESTVSQTTVGFISLAAIGFAIATIFQITSNL